MPLPPKDSWVRLQPGGSVILDEQSSKEWVSKTNTLRMIRGNFLVMAFELEQSIDAIIRGYFFPAQEQSKEIVTTFENIFLKSATASFARKINILRMLSHKSALSALISPDLLKNLEKFRDLRNRFAHYPISFDPATDDIKEKLVAKLICHDKEVTLDELFFKNAAELFNMVNQGLQIVCKQI